MFYAEKLAAAPAMGSGSSSVSLTRCWADSINAQRAMAEGRFDTFASPPCLEPADPDGIGLCPRCRQEIVG